MPDLRAAPRCRTGPPALRGQGRGQRAAASTHPTHGPRQLMTVLGRACPLMATYGTGSLVLGCDGFRTRTRTSITGVRTPRPAIERSGNGGRGGIRTRTSARFEQASSASWTHSPVVLRLGIEPRTTRVKSPPLMPLSYRSTERVTGIEPAFPGWKPGTLAIVLHPHMPALVLHVSGVALAGDHDFPRGSRRYRTCLLLVFSRALIRLS